MRPPLFSLNPAFGFCCDESSFASCFVFTPIKMIFNLDIVQFIFVTNVTLESVFVLFFNFKTKFYQMIKCCICLDIKRISVCERKTICINLKDPYLFSYFFTPDFFFVDSYSVKISFLPSCVKYFI